MTLQRIPAEFLKAHYSNSEHVPDLYWHPIPFVRELFYDRLEKIVVFMSQLPSKDQVVCDFGGGGGIFLPTLSAYFKKVVLMDLETKEAEGIVQEYHLQNVEILKGDVLLNSLPKDSFDIVVAADVLEHFINVQEPIEEIKRLLKPKGLFFVSAPTENFLYRLGRMALGFRKPADHFQDAEKIEETLARKSFEITKKQYIPYNVVRFGAFVILEAKNQKQ